MKIKYSWDYDRYVTEDGNVFRYDSKQDKFVLCGLSNNGHGYLKVGVSKPKRTLIYVHRLVFETFNGRIPQEMQLDHKNTIRTDNSLENLRCVTRKENMSNPLTRQKLKGNTNVKGKTWSEFGEKFKEHYGISKCDNPKLYNKEIHWYLKHNKVCSWE